MMPKEEGFDEIYEKSVSYRLKLFKLILPTFIIVILGFVVIMNFRNYSFIQTYGKEIFMGFVALGMFINFIVYKMGWWK
jgi:hypothetical protein